MSVNVNAQAQEDDFNFAYFKWPIVCWVSTSDGKKKASKTAFKSFGQQRHSVEELSFS